MHTLLVHGVISKEYWKEMKGDMKITTAQLNSRGIFPTSTWKAQRFLVDILAGLAEGGNVAFHFWK